MEGHHRARSSSTGQISNSPLNLDFDTRLNSSTVRYEGYVPPAGLQYNFIEGSTQFNRHVVPSNSFNDLSLDLPFQPNGISADLQHRPSALTIPQSPQQFHGELLGSCTPNSFEDFSHQHPTSKAGQQFDTNFLIGTEFHPEMQAQHTSVNPADLMSNMSSPLNIIPSPPNLIPPEAHSPRQGSPAPPQGQLYSPNHSRHTSLDPSSAIFAHNHQQADWSGMLHQTQFQAHRRAPSEHSDVSSAAPSPFLAQNDAFDLEYNHSPLIDPQQDNQLYSGLGMEQFNLNEPAQHQRRTSPGHSPYDSPRISPHMDLGNPQENFMLPQEMGGNFPGGPGPDIYPNQSEIFPQFNARHDSSDMGQAAQMTPPEINVEFAPTTKLPSFEPSRLDNDLDALSPPARGRQNRMRAKSETYISRPVSACSSSPHLAPIDADILHRQRSFSPFETTLSPNISRETSPARNSRRSSTSSIPTRDYILELADPNRPPASGTDKRVQKHPATFQCSLCPKRFTRAYNLRSHLRTHTDERPFICTVCGKAFARQHDRKRHEGLHSGEKKFVCKGDLGTGGNWGCGRRFARADALGRHFRSEAGRVCIKPLLDEEAMERQRGLDQQMLNQSLSHGGMAPPPPQSLLNGANGFTLPAALLAQYPALQGLQWDQLGQPGPGDDGEVSGRSSFDAGNPGDYFDDDDGEYVNGNGGNGGGNGFGAGGGWPQEVGEWHSDYEGR